jgi:hypothetical protein
MGLKLESIVPWGRNMDEYVRMFDLTEVDLTLQILDCAGGPASFNAEMTQRGDRVISCDPLYHFSASQIEQRIQATYEAIIEGVKANHDAYVWDMIPSPEQLGEIRMSAMRRFLADLAIGLEAGRYLPCELPTLPFAEGQFDLALCGHLLFTYTDHLSAEFHLDSIRELCRVAAEVRIFPLLNISGEASPVLPIVLAELSQQGYQLDLRQVPYEFQKGGNRMLVVRY